MDTCSTMMQQIVALPQPVIAAVQGVAIGGRLPARRELRSRRRRSEARLRHARRRHRTVLLDADGGAVAQRRAQARHGNAAHRRHRLGRKGRRHRPGQRGRAARPRARQRRSNWRMQFASKSSHVVGIGKAAFYRQIELPLAEAYRLRLEGDDREHDGARRRGRHLRLHREARSKLGRPLMIATAA